MKEMKVARGTARALRRQLVPMLRPSAVAMSAVIADAARHSRKMVATMHMKNGSVRQHF